MTTQLLKVKKSKNNKKYSEVRDREYLYQKEISQMCNAIKDNARYPIRDALLITMMYRHAFRISEIAKLRWPQIDLDGGTLHVNRIKNGIHSTHMLSGDEIRALRKIKKAHAYSHYVFNNERKNPMSTAAIREVVRNAGRWAGLDFPVHPHMLRHSTGYALVNKKHSIRAIQHYMGHANIGNTVRYTQLDTSKFDGFIDSLGI